MNINAIRTKTSIYATADPPSNLHSLHCDSWHFDGHTGIPFSGQQHNTHKRRTCQPHATSLYQEKVLQLFGEMDRLLYLTFLLQSVKRLSGIWDKGFDCLNRTPVTDKLLFNYSHLLHTSSIINTDHNRLITENIIEENC